MNADELKEKVTQAFDELGRKLAKIDDEAQMTGLASVCREVDSHTAELFLIGYKANKRAHHAASINGN